ncbi:MAG: hypothetical protein AAF628_00540 [Planctomycetota bacterium]
MPHRRPIFALLAGLCIGTLSLLLLRDSGHPSRASSDGDAAPAAAAARLDATTAPLSASSRPSEGPRVAVSPAAAPAAPTKAPLLVSGRLVDDLDQAVRGFALTARPLSERQLPGVFAGGGFSGKLPLATAGLGPALARDRPTRPKGIAPGDLTVHDLGDGRFEVRGQTRSERISLVASAQGRRIEVEAGIGANGLRVVIPRVGSVRAVLWHDGQAPGRAFAVRLRSPGGKTPPIELQAGGPGLERERPFHGIDVPVGIYDLDVALAEADGPALLTIAGVEVVEGQRTADPRLQRIDVRGSSRRIDVQLRRADGRPISVFDYANANVNARTPTGDVLSPPPLLKQSRVVIVTGHPYVDLHIELARYEPIELKFLRSGQVVNLEER